MVTVDQVAGVLFDEDHVLTDAETAELTRLLTAGVRAVEAELGGPIVAVEVTERVLAGSVLLLSKPNVTAVASVTPQGGSVLAGDTYELAGAGMVRPAYGYSWSGEQVVTYTAGWADGDTPAEVDQALIRYVQWSWSRSHGGSESYLPAGADAVPGLGIDGIRKEIRFILGDLAAGPVVA